MSMDRNRVQEAEIGLPFATSLNDDQLDLPLKSPNVKRHTDLLEEVNNMQEIEDSFRPATDEIDLLALKSVMGADFRTELVD